MIFPRTYLSLIFSFLFLFFCLPESKAQPGAEVRVSNNKVILEGKVYYIHVVKPGQTLYSISRAYQVGEKDIAAENPGVYSGLQIGQVLKIPSDLQRPAEARELPPVDTLKFTPHFLQEGETVYSLSKKYNISVNEIEKANPGLDYAGLSIGQRILIPKIQVIQTEEPEFIYHKVRRKETLYSLTRQYRVSEEVIFRYNPEVAERGLKTGQTIRIPETVVPGPSVQEDIGAGREIADSLSGAEGDEYSEPLNYEALLDAMAEINTRKLKIAFLVPFDYYDSLLPDTTADEKPVKADDEIELMEKNLPKSINFLEFFDGSILAVSKLKAQGYSLDVHYYDTRKSPSRVREILASDEFRGTNLIIGPFYSWNVEIVSEYSRQMGIPMVSPFYENTGLTARNPFLFQLNPSYNLEFSAAAGILAPEYEKNFIFVYSGDSLKSAEIEYFKSRLIEEVRKYNYDDNFVIKEIFYSNAARTNISADLKLAFSKDKTNLVIIPETNQAFVSNLVTQLFFMLREYRIEVFGMPHFAGFSNIDYRYYHDLNLRYVSPYYFSYSDSSIVSFLKDYRKVFRGEPGLSTKKGYPYAFAGYDITYFFARNMADNGKRFVRYLNGRYSDDLLVPFAWRRLSDFGGFENHHLSLVEYREGFSFSIKDVSRIPFERKVQPVPWTGPVIE